MTECQVCPEGTAMTEYEIETECEECTPGTYAESVLNITRWTPFPDQFINICRAKVGRRCVKTGGWRGSNYSLCSVFCK